MTGCSPLLSPVAVRALAAGASVKMLCFAAGLLVFVATGGGLGLAAVGLVGSRESAPPIKNLELVATKRVMSQPEPPKLDGGWVDSGVPDEYTEPLPTGAVARLGFVRFRHSGHWSAAMICLWQTRACG